MAEQRPSPSEGKTTMFGYVRGLTFALHVSGEHMLDPEMSEQATEDIRRLRETLGIERDWAETTLREMERAAWAAEPEVNP